MATRERPVDRGARRGRRLLDEIVCDFREARIEGSISQERAAQAIGRSDAWLSWTESGANQALSVLDLSKLLACVGYDLSIRAYPVGGGLRDEAQLALLQRFRSFVSPAWTWRSEVPMPGPGDLRAWDCVLTRDGVTIGVDAETRLRDVQAVDRRVMLKLRDSGLDRAVILIPSTRTNRAALRPIRSALRPNYPVDSQAALRALRRGLDPGGNAVVILAGPRPPRAERQATSEPPSAR